MLLNSLISLKILLVSTKSMKTSLICLTRINNLLLSLSPPFHSFSYPEQTPPPHKNPFLRFFIERSILKRKIIHLNSFIKHLPPHNLRDFQF